MQSQNPIPVGCCREERAALGKWVNVGCYPRGAPPAVATMPPVPGHTGKSPVPRGRQSSSAKCPQNRGL